MSTPPSHATQALEGIDKAIDDLEDEITNAMRKNEIPVTLQRSRHRQDYRFGGRSQPAAAAVATDDQAETVTNEPVDKHPHARRELLTARVEQSDGIEEGGQSGKT